ncbi:hypothetical protein EX30DRAFT_261407 [Ascodesmis nigricans]|uniref:Uncharacterized protein n=1 Tax=Ascodesmis nigricans TaxID=341454 RepID=A0A4S2MXJ4_9PEZI|nr:hypothetical protein EX30DRAFT_261407 [Ascodesmis nigricans]
MDYIHEDDDDRLSTGPDKRPRTSAFPYSQPRRHQQRQSQIAHTRHSNIPSSAANRPSYPLLNPSSFSSFQPVARGPSRLEPGSGLRSYQGAALSQAGERSATISPQRPRSRHDPLSILSAEQHRRDEELLRIITSPARHRTPRAERTIPTFGLPSHHPTLVPPERRDQSRHPSFAAPRPDCIEERRRKPRETFNLFSKHNFYNESAAMIRMRTADGGEVVSPGSGMAPPPYGTDDGSNRPPTRLGVDRDRLALRDGIGRGKRLTSSGTIFGHDDHKGLGLFRRSPTPTGEREEDWMRVSGGQRAGQGHGKDGKQSGLRGGLSKMGATPTRKVSRRESSGSMTSTGGPMRVGHLNRKTSNESIRSIDSSGASSRGATGGPRRITGGRSLSRSSASRIPVSSPSPSRPTSSQSVTRKTFSTVSSASDRVPLRSPTSTASLKDQAAAQTSPRKRSYIPINQVPRRTGVTSGTPKKMSQPSAPSLQRSKTLPNSQQHHRTVSESMPPKISVEDDSRHEEPPPQRYQQPEAEQELRKMLESEDFGTPTPPRRKRGFSMDSGLSRPIKHDDSPDGNRRPSLPGSAESTSEIPAPDSLISPTLSDYDELYNLQHGGNTPESPTPTFDRSSGQQKISSRTHSVLEDEDSELESLQGALLGADEGYKSLLQGHGEDEDDTYSLIAATRHFGRGPSKVRSRKEALHADLENARKAETHDKLMNKLKTLHLELRSARRGIDYIERRLNGAASSDDESEWVDEEEAQRYEEERKAAEKAKELERPKIEIFAKPGPVASVPPTEKLRFLAPMKPNGCEQWIMLAVQLAILWVLLEVAIFYRSFPPSVSSVPIEIAAIPSFGTHFTRTIFSAVYGTTHFVVIGIPSFFWSIVAGFFHVLYQIFSVPRIWLGGLSAQWQKGSDVFETVTAGATRTN